jgi:hypothetical protein
LISLLKNIKKFIQYDSQQHKFIKSELNTKSENALTKLITKLVEYHQNYETCVIAHISYMLATAKIETYNYLEGILFEPISELGDNMQSKCTILFLEKMRIEEKKPKN